MKLGFTSLLVMSLGMFSCSSSDGPSGGGSNSSGNNTPGEIPTNNDNGNHNSPSDNNPDNINPGDDGSGSGSGSDSGSDSSSWEIYFEDNFDGTDMEPNPEYWTLAPKGDKTWNRYMSESYNQAYQKEGYLYLFGMEKDGEYYTGGIETRNKIDFTYGQVKCRARFLRQPKGNHTGIWMMPQTQPEAWPRYGEIDIMEHLNDDDIIYSTVHYWNQQEESDGKTDTTAQIDNDDFNVYGIVWNNDAVAFTLNGQVILTYKNDNPDSGSFSYQYPFTRDFYIILSQSLGGEGTWEGPIDNSELPAVFQIDWIKVWQKN